MRYTTAVHMGLANFLPTRRFFIALLGIGILLILTLVLLRVMRNSGITSDTAVRVQQLSLEDQVKELQDVSIRDTDADGLKDWEEGLWGLNPRETDTDKDGTNDFAEVEKERERLRAENVAEGNQEEVAPEDGGASLSATDQFSRDLYTTVSLLQQDGSLDDNQGLIANRIIQTINDVTLATPVDQVALTFVDTTQASVQTYIIAMGNLFKTHPLDREELGSIFAQVSQNMLPDSLSGTIDKYQTLVSAMEKIPTPIAIKTQHVAIINTTRALVGFLQALAQIESDPLITMAGIKNMGVIFDNLADSYVAWYAALNMR